MTHAAFKKEIWKYYRQSGRSFPWRTTKNPYRILVSEIMLQQTQTYRVEAKYAALIKRFPNFKSLTSASVVEVLKVWQGLGYNRRALYLKKTAEVVVAEYGGKLPADLEKLRALPGIGPNTAGSILAFAFNRPAVFIETNIRRVFIHFFFKNKENVHDRDIFPLVEKTLDHRNPREWYYALMDYGAHLAKQTINPNRRSKHYTKQSKFIGSDREARGMILKTLLAGPRTTATLAKLIGRKITKIKTILADLEQEGFIVSARNKWQLAS